MSDLRRLRLEHEPPFSIPALAEASGVSPEQIRNIEAGRTQDPRPETLAKLADALGVRPIELDPVLNRSAA